MERGSPQVGPARFDGVSPQFFGALEGLWLELLPVVAPKNKGLTPSTASGEEQTGWWIGVPV
jgi:hypothetical protein